MRSDHLIPVLLCVGALGACAKADPPGAHDRGRDVEGPIEDRVIRLARRIPHLETYPCGEQCHDELAPNPQPRALTEFHTTIELAHGESAQWCDFCHRTDELDELHLINGETLGFDQSDRLCGQCHAEKHAQWKAGIHTVDTAWGAGEPLRRTCTACHDPHAPGPIVFEALPPPPHPHAH